MIPYIWFSRLIDWLIVHYTHTHSSESSSQTTTKKKTKTNRYGFLSSSSSLCYRCPWRTLCWCCCWWQKIFNEKLFIQTNKQINHNCDSKYDWLECEKWKKFKIIFIIHTPTRTHKQRDVNFILYCLTREKLLSSVVDWNKKKFVTYLIHLTLVEFFSLLEKNQFYTFEKKSSVNSFSLAVWIFCFSEFEKFVSSLFKFISIFGFKNPGVVWLIHGWMMLMFCLQFSFRLFEFDIPNTIVSQNKYDWQIRWSKQSLNHVIISLLIITVLSL